MSVLTVSQQQAIAARGNVLVVAGAGTGKTHTLIERCLSVLLKEHCSLEDILMVTFTDAAAAEMRRRIRGALQEQCQQQPDEPHLAEQLALLDTAHVATLHSFCLQLVRQHFYELEIDPQVAVLDERQTGPLIGETLDALLRECYADSAPYAAAVQALIRQLGRGSDQKIRDLVVKVHRYTQSRPAPGHWFDEQLARFAQAEPAQWHAWFDAAFREWAARWRPRLESLADAPPNVTTCLKALSDLPANPARAEAGAALRAILDAEKQEWPRGTKTTIHHDLKEFFNDAAFLVSLMPEARAPDPLEEDWEWVRPQMTALLQLARAFTDAFATAKRELGGIDFADIEQLTLRLLRDEDGRPTATAQQWRQRLRHVFVDEYQDINPAQDSILTALSREGGEANRFLVGDIKQSIYRFRLADPNIFRGYEEAWRNPPAPGTRIALADNFRSREAILHFINPLFAALMRPAMGGVAYDADAQLRFGDPAGRQALARSATAEGGPRVEFHLLAKDGEGAGDGEAEETSPGLAALFDLQATEREARLVALRLRELQGSGHLIWDEEEKKLRPAEWRDMVVLLRSPRGKVEAYAKEFNRAGVPLLAERGGFFESTEINDLLGLLKLLDNPLQDVPLLAVLRSPLVGLSLDELAEIRAHDREPLFWTALRRFHGEGRKSEGGTRNAPPVWARVDLFLGQFERWRDLIRHTSLSNCLETALGETHYESLLLAGARGAARLANVRRLLELARQYDPYQRQGLFRFLRFVAAQQEAGLDEGAAPVTAGNAVRLTSIHRSKGLEFPVVVVADLGKTFNLSALREDILLDEVFGLCPQVTPPDADQRYPSLPYWLARQRELKELLGEELRLFYVALTRARDTLVLTGTAARKGGGGKWDAETPARFEDPLVLGARSFLDWLRMFLPQATQAGDWKNDREGGSALLRWKIYSETDAVLAGAATAARDAAANAEFADAGDAGALARLRERIEWRYSFTAATTEPAKTSVSALRRRLTDELDEEARPLLGFAAGRRARRPGGGLSAGETGTAHHRFMQYASLSRLGSVAEARGEVERLTREGWLAPAEAAALDVPALAAFWDSELGRRIRAQGNCVQRELPFTARFSPEDLPGLDRAAAGLEWRDEFVVVQGVVDLAVILPTEIWLVDFKTDGVTRGDLAQKVQFHAPQLKLYSLALERIFQRAVTERWLHFLVLRESCAVPVAGRNST